MGKQTRRKRSRRSSSSGQQTGRTPPNNNSSAQPPQSTTLLNRIRHSDASTRHAALAALSSTLLSSQSLSATTSKQGGNNKKRRNKKLTEELLKAICERIMDDDVDVAVMACRCMNNYVAFGDDGGEEEDGVVRVLGPILVGRVGKCCDGLERLSASEAAAVPSSASENSKQTEDGDTAMGSNDADGGVSKKKSNRKRKGGDKNKQSNGSCSPRSLWSVASASLSTLSSVIEIHPYALQRLTVDSSSPQGGDLNPLLSTLFRILSLAKSTLEGPARSKVSATSAAAGASGGGAIAEEEELPVRDAAISSARCLHSSLDENDALVSSLLSSTRAGEGIALTTSVMESGSMPPMARLHSAGAIVSLRQTVLLSSSSSAAAPSQGSGVILDRVQSDCMEKALPLLKQFAMYHPPIASALARRVVDAKERLTKEEEDSMLEREVVRKVQKRKEPAREIARRQKIMKESKVAQKEEETKENSVAAMEEDADQNEKEEGVDNGKVDATEVYERALDAWSDSLQPIKLALELSANVCAGVSGQSSDGGGGADCAPPTMGGEDDDDIMWGSDDEAQLRMECADSASAKMARAVQHHPRDVALFDAVVGCDLPDQVVHLVGLLTSPVLATSTEKADHSSALAAASVPDEIQLDIAELQSKAGACLGNMIGNLPSWRESDDAIVEVWSEIGKAIVAILPPPPGSGKSDLRSGSAATKSPHDSNAGISGLASAMTTSLRSRLALRKRIGDADLHLILRLLSDSPCDDAQRDAATMLGILCAESHTDGINAKVCAGLLEALNRPTSTVAVQSEVLNVIMDVYGLDDDDPNSHSSVFKEKDVLGNLQRSLPTFKRRIREEDRKRDAASRLEVEEWRETALNVSRFIQYKKETMG